MPDYVQKGKQGEAHKKNMSDIFHEKEVRKVVQKKHPNKEFKFNASI